MIDFHSHILPHFDDGAKDAATGLEMLRMSADSGIDTVVSTSHFYPEQYSNASDFIHKRGMAFAELKDAAESEKFELPRIVLGAEVYLGKKLSRVKNLHALCIGDTDYMMLEMPYDDWKEDDFEEIYQITRLGICPVMANLDRFMKFKKQFGELFSLGVLVQVNASAVLDNHTRRNVLELFDMEAVHAIGSDMHNTVSRPPNAAQAYELIKTKFGADYRRYVEYSAGCILENKEPPRPKLHKITGLKRILI